jgi:predicted nucleotidyltransferase
VKSKLDIKSNFVNPAPDGKERLHKELKNVLKQLKRFNIKKVILFGSLARGDVGITSDIDLIVILESDVPFHKRLKKLYEEIDYHEPLHLLAYTPEELERTLEVSSFLRYALREGKVIYEAE